MICDVGDFVNLASPRSLSIISTRPDCNCSLVFLLTADRQISRIFRIEFTDWNERGPEGGRKKTSTDLLIRKRKYPRNTDALFYVFFTKRASVEEAKICKHQFITGIMSMMNGRLFQEVEYVLRNKQSHGLPCGIIH